MKKILIAYSTFAGSTAEVAKVIGEEIAQAGLEPEILPMAEVASLQGYDGVVLGGPMIMGWHRKAMRFLRKHRKDLEGIPFAVFVMCMSLTNTGQSSVEGIPITVDGQLPELPKAKGRLTLRERYANLESYLRPIVRAARPFKPESIGVFGGRLEYGRLKWWAVLFVMVVVQAPAGDRRNWDAIRSWASGLPGVLRMEPEDSPSNGSR